MPQQAVQTGQDGQFVFVVKPDSTVEQRPVVAGQRVGDDVVVAKGLQPGETVVTEGQLRLEDGHEGAAQRRQRQRDGPRRTRPRPPSATGSRRQGGTGAGTRGRRRQPGPVT